MMELMDRTGFQSSRRMLRHTLPSRSMLGWYTLVIHFTLGASCGYNPDTLNENEIAAPLRPPAPSLCQSRPAVSAGAHPDVAARVHPCTTYRLRPYAAVGYHKVAASFRWQGSQRGSCAPIPLEGTHLW